AGPDATVAPRRGQATATPDVRRTSRWLDFANGVNDGRSRRGGSRTDGQRGQAGRGGRARALVPAGAAGEFGARGAAGGRFDPGPPRRVGRLHPVRPLSAAALR